VGGRDTGDWKNEGWEDGGWKDEGWEDGGWKDRVGTKEKQVGIEVGETDLGEGGTSAKGYNVLESPLALFHCPLRWLDR
jgi:hypothetical protein